MVWIEVLAYRPCLYLIAGYFFFQAQTLGREPTCEELFKDTHCKVKDKTFVDKKSAKKYVSLAHSIQRIFICYNCRFSIK